MFKRIIVAVMILTAAIFSTVSAESAKSDQWLIYWYVCGTDIETTRIAFEASTDLMSNDTNKLVLAEPDRRPGDATRSIKEVEKADLSPNVKIFMQAGGTYIWGHEKFRDLNAKIQTDVTAYNRNDDGTFSPVQGTVLSGGKVSVYQWFLASRGGGDTVATPIQNGKIGRYVYDKYHHNWYPYEQKPISGLKNTETDMGSKEGLISFLQTGQKLEQELYPDGNVRRVLILKDHGGGFSICSDEYTKNIIALSDIEQAFNDVRSGWTNSDEKPFEVVAFDACLMSTYEAALALEKNANYMVASQETTFGKGNMSYTALLNELSKNPTMSGKELSKIICNTGWKDSKIVDKEYGLNTNAVFTLSVVDLSEQKMNALKMAYANFSTETTKIIEKNSNSNEIIYTFSKFKNAANSAERYPSSNTLSNQWLVDVKDFTDNIRITFPDLKDAGRDLLKAVNNSVIYNKRGSVLYSGGGLSTKFPTNFYNTLKNKVQDYSIDINYLTNKLVEVDKKNKTAKVELTEDDLKNVESVRYQIIYLPLHNDGTNRVDAMFLGNSNELQEDRQKGIFKINLNDQKIVTLDGVPLWVQIVSDSTRKDKNGKKIKGKDICTSPILLNEKPYKLFFTRSYPSGKIMLIGVAPNDPKDNESNLPSGELRNLKKGDVVIPQYFYLTEENVENLEKVENLKSKPVEEITEKDKGIISELFRKGKAITIGDKSRIEMRPINKGLFGYLFEFVNPISGESVFMNEGVVCEIKNGEIIHVEDYDFGS